VKKPEGKRPLGRPRHRWGIILESIIRKWDVGVWIGLGWLRIVTGACECVNEPLSSMQCGEFLD
jgi:hypothetical protein